MLVLSRKKNESIEAVLTPELLRALLESIGAQVDLTHVKDDTEPLRITATVVEVRGNLARLGFEATFNDQKLGREMPIHRKEIIDRMEEGKTGDLTYESIPAKERS